MGFLDFFLPGLDAAGQASSAAMTYKIAKENRDWQERMANTAHQRAAKDLSAAGLNRVLALGSPAVTPAGNAPTLPSPDLSRASARAADVKLKGKQGQHVDAQIERELAQARLADSQSMVNAEQVKHIQDQRTNLASQVHLRGIQGATEGRRGDLVGAQIGHEELRMEGTSYDLERRRVMADLWREWGDVMGPGQALKLIPQFLMGAGAIGALGKIGWAAFRRLPWDLKKRLIQFWRRKPTSAQGASSMYDRLPPPTQGWGRSGGNPGQRADINPKEIPF